MKSVEELNTPAPPTVHVELARWYSCPTCGEDLPEGNYRCVWCAQRIRWSTEDEND